MPAWPGGPCPVCDDDMPENLVHCQTCRALLNDDLQADSVHIPQFVPLAEIEAMVETEPRGFFIACPACQKELRINRKFHGETVSCKFCQNPFLFDLNQKSIEVLGFYSACPHCNEELRAATKYYGEKCLCKSCEGQIHFVEWHED
ncbi:50S ribosomal protein L20 [hydrothermal vent metagenome]|uniref:50S ribosomal protein L20 n=1 Tax=hydrothermal vent metagenome TaxID=652676 RepID=A0A3B1DQK7_9ZZZZ